MSVKHKPLLHETVAAGMRSEVAAVTEEYHSTLHIGAIHKLETVAQNLLLDDVSS